MRPKYFGVFACLLCFSYLHGMDWKEIVRWGPDGSPEQLPEIKKTKKIPGAPMQKRQLSPESEHTFENLALLTDHTRLVGPEHWKADYLKRNPNHGKQ